MKLENSINFKLLEQDDRIVAAKPVPFNRNSVGAPLLVYIVDDQKNVAAMIAVYLRRSGYRTRVFQNPLSALSAFARATPKPSLLIADFSMPEMDGLELMRHCRHLHPSLRVILISGSMATRVLQQSGLGPDAVLDKPLPLQQLAATVEALVGRNLNPHRWTRDAADMRVHATDWMGNPPLVYIVDDERVVTEMVSMHLLRSGYRTRAFMNPTAAFSAFIAATPKPAVLITDFGMPEMSGLELMRRCRRLDPGVRVVIMSGSLNADRFDGCELKPDGFLGKPFSPVQLLGEVGSLVGGSTRR